MFPKICNFQSLFQTKMPTIKITTRMMVGGFHCCMMSEWLIHNRTCLFLIFLLFTTFQTKMPAVRTMIKIMVSDFQFGGINNASVGQHLTSQFIYFFPDKEGEQKGDSPKRRYLGPRALPRRIKIRGRIWIGIDQSLNGNLLQMSFVMG